MRIYICFLIGTLCATLSLNAQQIPIEGATIVTNPLPSEAPTNANLSVGEPASVWKLDLSVERVTNNVIQLSWNTAPNLRCYDLMISTDMTNWSVHLPFPPVNTNRVKQLLDTSKYGTKKFFRVVEVQPIPEGFIVTKTSNTITNEF